MLISLRIVICLAIMVTLPTVPIIAAYPYEKYGLDPNMLLILLEKTRKDRKTFAFQDSFLGQDAPQLFVEACGDDQSGKLLWPPNKVCVLAFWSIHCGPCIASIPQSNKLAKLLEANGGIFLSVHAAGEKPIDVKKICRRHSIKYPVFLDSAGGNISYWGGKTFERYGVTAIPQYVTINKNNQILSWKQPETDYLIKLFKDNNNKKILCEAKQIPVIIYPKELDILVAVPNQEVGFKFVVCRPDTPKLKLKEIKTEKNIIEVTTKKYSKKSQVAYELSAKTITPGYGGKIRDEIILIIENDGTEELFKIPCLIKTRNLTNFNPSCLFFGKISSGEQKHCLLTLCPCTKNESIKAEFEYVPSNITVSPLNVNNQNKNDLVFEITFFAAQPSVTKDDIIIRVSDSQGESQILKIKCLAYAE